MAKNTLTYRCPGGNEPRFFCKEANKKRSSDLMEPEMKSAQTGDGRGKGIFGGSFVDWAMDIEPWAEPIDGKRLLDELAGVFKSWVVMPKFTPEACALFTVHTYAYHLREVTAYLGIESPLKRCGKSTLLAVLSAVVNRPVVSSNISPPAFFRVIEEARPTLLIDEADTLLKGNDELRGILNSGYTRSTAFVVRVANQPGQSGEPGAGVISTKLRGDSGGGGGPATTPGLMVYSCWCPKVMAAIGHLPDTLADRCIVIRMQRKTAKEQCERLRNLKPIADGLRRRCARFVLDHGERIAAERPAMPRELNDRAPDVWEPLVAIADICGGQWPEQARQAACGLAESSREGNPIGSLLLDIYTLYTIDKTERVFTRELVGWLNGLENHAWAERTKGKPINELWLAQQLRPYRIFPRSIRIGERVSRGYYLDDFMDSFRRYISRADLLALRERWWHLSRPRRGRPERRALGKRRGCEAGRIGRATKKPAARESGTEVSFPFRSWVLYQQVQRTAHT